MPFHRFEQFASRLLTPHLSSGRAPVLEGGYMYFCMLHEEAGTGSELHYHPLVQSTAWLENGIDGTTPAEQACTRIERKAN